ncbi:hypothetical protein Tco_0997717 [Tanacetum coccineum]
MEPNTVHITNKVSMENATMMTKLVNDEEVKKALFDICDNKALGPDGFTSKFYKKAWNIVGKDVCEAVKEFFSIGQLLRELLPCVLMEKGMDISKEEEDLGNNILCHPKFLLLLLKFSLGSCKNTLMLTVVSNIIEMQAA